MGKPMTAWEKRVVAILFVLFFLVGVAALRQGWLLFGAPSRQVSPINEAGLGIGKAIFPGEETGTPFAPVWDTPAAASPIVTEAPAATEEKTIEDDLTLAEALQQDWTPVQQGWTTITVFTPWGEPMVFSFLPVVVDFQQPGFGDVCPFYEQKACVSIQEDGIYALTHSEYPGAVAEQARSVVEGTLFSLEVIRSNVARLPGAEARIELADGRVLSARVEYFNRVTGPLNMSSQSNQRQAAPGALTIEFCGLPHLQDGTEPLGTTGSIYVLTIVKSD